tara:strand:- start:9578 stop:11722 length:2145 start_codon:yes stop_codon:yes gene_type:complete
MADPEEPEGTEETASSRNYPRAAELREAKKVLEEIKALNLEVTAAREAEYLKSFAILDNLKTQRDVEKDRIRLLEDEFAGMKKNTAARRESAEEIKKEIKERRDAQKVRNKLIRDGFQQEVALHKDKAKQVRDQNLANFMQQDELAKARAAGNEKELEGFVEHAKAGFGAIDETVKQMGVALGSMLQSPELALMGLFQGMGKSLKTIQTEINKMPAQLDSAISGMAKKSALPIKELGDTLVNAIDPEYARRIGVSFAGIPAPLRNIGLTAKDTAASMQGLIDGAAIFRPTFMQNEKAASSFLVNTVAGFAKIGVSTKTSAGLINTFTKALKQAPVESAKSLKSIASVADSLGLNMGKVMGNLQQMTPQIAMFGDRMIDVFADLQAQAQGTGMEINKLLGVAMKMDTFEGAAKHAQSLNAVLGQAAISVTDLVHADPADKIGMIQDAIAGAGIDFETADRRMKQVIATAAGFDSVEDAAKVLLNKEDAEEAADAVDTATMSQAEFSRKVNDSLTVAEKMTKSLSSMTGGMKKILETVQPGAVKFSNVMGNAFGKIQQRTKNSAAAVLGFQAGLKGIRETGKASKEILHDLSEAISGVVKTSPKLLKLMAAVVGTGSIIGTGMGARGAWQFGSGVTEGATGEPPAGEDTGAAGEAIERERERVRATEERALAAAEAPTPGTFPAMPDIQLSLNLEGDVLDKRTIKLFDESLRLGTV